MNHGLEGLYCYKGRRWYRLAALTVDLSSKQDQDRSVVLRILPAYIDEEKRSLNFQALLIFVLFFVSSVVLQSQYRNYLLQVISSLNKIVTTAGLSFYLNRHNWAL